MNRILLFALLTMLLSACAPGGPPDISSDMTEFLAQKGLSNASLECSLLGNGITSGPDGLCLLPLTDTEVDAIVSTLGLQQKTDTVVSWSPSGPDCWTRLDFHDQTVARWYVSPADDPGLQLQNGMRWVYFRLFYHQNKSAGCISISYSR